MLSRILSAGGHGGAGHTTAMSIPISTHIRPNAGSGGTIGWMLVKLRRRPYEAIIGKRVIVLRPKTVAPCCDTQREVRTSTIQDGPILARYEPGPVKR